MDINYIPIQGNFIDLCAGIDWFSLAVLARELSNTIDASFCVQVVARAIAQHGVLEIFNTDQGCQFTSAEFTQPLPARSVKLSMDDRATRSTTSSSNGSAAPSKYDAVYLKSQRSQIEAYTNLETFFHVFNERRPHSAFGDSDPKTPMDIYRQPLPLAINE